MEKMYLTVTEAAEMLSIGQSSLYRQVQAGKIPGVKHFGKLVRIHRETLEKWAKANGKGSARKTGELI